MMKYVEIENNKNTYIGPPTPYTRNKPNTSIFHKIISRICCFIYFVR